MDRIPKNNQQPDNCDTGSCIEQDSGTADPGCLPGETIPLGLKTPTHNAYTVPAICGFLLLAVALVFGQTLRYEFVGYDDEEYVYANPHVASGLTARGIAWAFTTGHANNWHPLTWISHMVDCQFYGLHAGGHHLTSVLVHAAVAILLFLVLLRMTGALWSGAFVAAVFAIHPLRAESVAWVAERKDVLSGLFFMLTLWAYVGYVRHPFSIGRYLTVMGLFALGLMSKPMLVTLPFVLLLLDYWPLGRSELSSAGVSFPFSRRVIIEKLPLLALVVASCVATFIAQGEAVVPIDAIPVSLRIANALVSTVAYLGDLVYPMGLAVFYPHPGSSLPIWRVVASTLALTGITTLALAWRRRFPYLFVGWFWYVGMMVPVIGLVQVGSHSMADRYTYLPQIGLWIVITWGVGQLAASWRHRRWVCGVASGLTVLVLMGFAWRQTSYWKDSEALWTQALACTARNDVAHNNLGKILADRGEVDAAITHYQKALEIKPDDAMAHYNLGVALAGRGQIDAAIAHYQKALEVNPDYVEAHNNLGNVLRGRGQVDAAIAHYQKALEIEPADAETHNNFGIALAGLGQIDTAIIHFQKVLEIRPNFAECHNNLGIALAMCGQIGPATAHFRQAVESNPRYAGAHYNLGTALDRQGNIADAVIHWREAVRLQPDQVANLSQLANALATSPSGEIRNGAEAVELARRAVGLTNGQEPTILNTLAAAYAEAGRFPEAVETAKQAGSLATARGDTALADTVRVRIKLYQAGSPYREMPQAPRN